MASPPPPQGLTELDYEAIEAAVTETVRGRWFLSEFARRNRLAETRQLLDAMSRLESVVASNQVAMPSADPSIRLMIQRIKEIAGQLGVIATHMSEAGVDEQFVSAVSLQGRAVAGMMRGASLPPKEPAAPLPPIQRPPHVETSAPAPAPTRRAHVTQSVEIAADDPRLVALSALDGLPLSQKLTLFS